MSPAASRKPADGGDSGLGELKKLCVASRGVAAVGLVAKSTTRPSRTSDRYDPAGLQDVPLFAPSGGRPQPTPIKHQHTATKFATTKQPLDCAATRSRVLKHEDDEPRCLVCHLPVANCSEADNNDKAALIHGECKAQLLLKAAKAEEESKSRKDRATKRAQREKYGIGWKPEDTPRCSLPEGLRSSLPALKGKCGVALPSASNAVELVPTANQNAAVNLEYLAVAIQVRRSEGREPVFSLDPDYRALARGGGRDAAWQRKRFEPEWLGRTSMGEVMFQADYHLKELSMGEQAQPVAGMKSCFDMFKEDSDCGGSKGWTAREWFVVKGATLGLSEDQVLEPTVQMAVEAREILDGPNGPEDARMTSSSHPLVRYAQAFSHYFDLIAERKSVVHELQEVAKACLVAKHLLDANVHLEDHWLAWAEEACTRGDGGCEEIPQLWNEQRYHQINLQDGKMSHHSGSEQSVYGVYGGVEMTLDRIELANLMVQAKKSLVVSANIPTEARVPQGVDLNMDSVNVALGKSDKGSGSWSGPNFTGNSFWTAMECELPEPEEALLKAVFHPSLSDRKEEGELFLPPNAAEQHVARLRSLLAEEEAVRKQRLEHFRSSAFSATVPGPLFPSTWAPSCEVARQDLRCKPLHPRPDYVADALRLLKAQNPSFDKKTEDGTRFRLYSVGSLEVRTVQASGQREEVCAVFSTLLPAGRISQVTGSEEVVKVTQYVEKAGGKCDLDQVPQPHFFTLLETIEGASILTELVAPQSVRWAVAPSDLEARCSLAKVLRAQECRCGAGELRALAEGQQERYSAAAAQRLAQRLYDRACCA